MGAVYAGEDVKSGERVAIKIIQTKVPVTAADLVARFEREARAAGSIDTEHIARCLGAGTDPVTEQPYMVLEYLEGEDLQRVLRRTGPLDPDLALRIVAQACVGLMGVISYYKGRLYETDGRLDAAANEFQRVVDGEARGPLIDGIRSEAQVLLNRLATGLGVVVFKNLADGQCVEEKLWVSPGNPTIRHGGTQQALRIRARQTVTLGECK